MDTAPTTPDLLDALSASVDRARELRTETPSGGNHRARTAVPEVRAPGEEVEQPSPAAPSRPVDRITWTGPLHVEQDVRHDSWTTTVALTDDANRQLARDLADRHMTDLVLLSRLRQQEKKLRRGRFDVAARQAAHEAQQIEARLAGALQSTATTQWVHTPMQAEQLWDQLEDAQTDPDECAIPSCSGNAIDGGSYCAPHDERGA